MNLKNKLENEKFLLLSEMRPPKGVDVSSLTANALRVKDKVDAFVVSDMNMAVLHMSSLGCANLFQKKGLETIMQINCRDRNRLALQADLLAAYACGISNIMVIKGEDPRMGDNPETKAVYDVDTAGLLDIILNLQKGRDMTGGELSGSTSFLVGSTFGNFGKEDNLAKVIEGMEGEAEKGVQFFVTPPVFDLAVLDPLVKRIDRAKIKIIPTILILKSVGMARYLAVHQDDIHIPETVIERIQNAADTAGECLSFAAETIKKLKEEGFGGALLATVGWENKLPVLLEKLET